MSLRVQMRNGARSLGKAGRPSSISSLRIYFQPGMEPNGILTAHPEPLERGHIACGTFVVYTLQDAGFKIPSKMARQPSENIIKNLIGPSNIMRFSNAVPMQKVLEWIRSQDEGLFIVGMDIHVGFIINKAGNITFCHSNYYDPPRAVVNQDARERSPLTDSKYLVFGKILDNAMMIRWLKHELFPVTYDFFRRN
ncbi:MAG: hypothetical protein COZ70_15800 [Deltaproteobacteria bacterium CG_4_8_14_3_um_filter_51_11]|nr:MAG: hypothetical protein COZ70_15800 [Deltaproteobacteria bacterium CG_4_8_14_3_um_filter_51_11]PJB36992.1 MAG: hypothetical protein CO107_06140 [Deltaproteobacteria bacterium CG_4_9_14_3_um_filter_51_14]